MRRLLEVVALPWLAVSLACGAEPIPLDGPTTTSPPTTPAITVMGNSPVYRWRSSAEHFWTNSRDEQPTGYEGEGVSFYVSATQGAKFSVPLFRLQGPAGHVYTSSRPERDALVGHGYADEGTIGFIASSAGAGTQPLYSSRDPRSELRFLSTDGDERPQGWPLATVIGHVPSPYRIGAYYFGMWSPDALSSPGHPRGFPFANPTFYSEFPSGDWWMGVRDLRERTPIQQTRTTLPVSRWVGGADHFWTTDPAGEGAPGLGYVKESPHSFYVAPSASGQYPRAVWRLLGPAGHVFTPSAAEYQRLKATPGYVEEGKLGFIADTPSAITLPLYSWKKPDELRLLTVDANEDPRLYDASWVSEGVVGHAPRFFNDHSAFSRWWRGSDAAATDGWNYLQPAIGYYDLSPEGNGPRVLEQQIMQARQNGISFFSFYWYWSVSFGGMEDFNDGLESFLLARNSSEMSFSLAIAAHGGFWSIYESGQSSQKAIDKLVGYFARPNYLRNAAGQPIVTILDSFGVVGETAAAGGNRDWPALRRFVEQLRSRTHERTGQWPVILASDGDPATFKTGDASTNTGPTAPVSLVELVEGVTCLTNPALGTLDQSNWAANEASGALPRKPFMPCGTQRWDTRPRMGVMEGKKLDDLSFFADSAATFPARLRATKEWIDAQSSELSHMLVLYAWNEWHEGGIIEPNIRDGALHLDTIARTFQLPMGNDPCRRTGICAGGPTRLRSVSGNRCLEVADASTPRAQQSACGASQPKQTWSLVPSQAGYQLVSSLSAKCLEVEGASASDGARVLQTPCPTAAQGHQRWTVVATNVAGAFRIRAMHSGKCLVVSASGAEIQQSACSSGAPTGELWRFR